MNNVGDPSVPASSPTLGTNLTNQSVEATTSQDSRVVPSQILQTGLTRFVEVDGVVENQLRRVRGTDDEQLFPSTITSFLERPYLVNSTDWTTSSTAGTNLFNVVVGTELYNNAIWANKLSGYTFFRGTAVLRVNINANPFQQGKLLIHFLPCVNQQDTSYTAKHNAMLATTTQQPNVMLDCRETSAIIRIPYVAPTDYYCLDGDNSPLRYSWGTFWVDVLSPLLTGASGDTNVEVATFLHFEDVELTGPIIPQMSGVGSDGRKGRASRITTRNITEKEQAALVENSIGSVLTKASTKIAKSLSEVPLLRQVAGVASWVIEGVEGLASFFGWAKPQVDSVPIIVSDQFNRHMATSDGADTSVPLGLLTENKLDINENISYTDEDEMSLNYLKRIKAYFGTFSWSTSQTPNTQLYNLTVAPYNLEQSMQKTYTAGTSSVTATYYAGPPIYYLTNFFALYRGSVEIEMHFIKTNFHSGRLQILYFPYTGSSTQNTTLTTVSNQPYILREIVDIRYTDKIVLNLPYLLPYEYASMDDPMGYLQVIVLNTLCAPETVSSSLNVVLFARGGEDFEFQVPSYGNMGGYGPFSPQMDTGLIAGGVGGAIEKKQALNSARYCIGEYVSSIKQLLSRFSAVSATNSLQALANGGFRLWPYFANIGYVDASTLTLACANLGGDAFSMFVHGYAFYRGGVRMSIALPTGTSYSVANLPFKPRYSGQTANSIFLTNQSSYSNYFGGGGLVQPFSPAVAMPATCGVAQPSNGGNFITVHLPYYAPTKCTVAAVQTTADTIPLDYSQPLSTVYVAQLDTATNGNTAYKRAFADDFQLSYFVGFPPVLGSLT